ncbi:LysR family transcriptional regulator [Thalassospira sp.]|uniref:LysR family transcriptional regulator n=1 Tax=Thalassospira sp. TaxID=1912094 RepID=UPI0027334B68|nr:LysR family transcriptional regulator [Thalassospira sp.]MDP2699514.1 LysR family transcriptional regulator [Thalassospira sp.]
MMMDQSDLKLLRIFVTIVEAGGFAPAQSQLNLSLSTISSYITTLETRLGFSLCKRGRGGFSLTGEGQTVFDDAHRLFKSVGQFETKMRSLRDKLNGTLTIGLTDNTITDPNSSIEGTIARFVEQAPDVTLHLLTYPPNELLREVVTGAIQIGICSFPKTVLGLTYIDLYSEMHRFYCGQDHPLFHMPDDRIDIDEIRRYRIVGRKFWLGRDLKDFAIARPHATVSDMEAEARLILSGAFLGYLPEHYAQQFVGQGRMRAIRPDQFFTEAMFQASFDTSQQLEPITQLFLDMLIEDFNQRRPA